MSKIGRKPIDISAVEIKVAGQEVHIKGPKWSGVHSVPGNLVAKIEDKKLLVSTVNKKFTREDKVLWGLHRAMLANKIKGAATPFERKLQIIGLGFKALVANKKIELSVGFSHKVHIPLPDQITVELDKTGQLVTMRSPDKEMLGALCSRLRSYRPPEPYKGTGIKYMEEVIKRKAGKAKVSGA